MKYQIKGKRNLLILQWHEQQKVIFLGNPKVMFCTQIPKLFSVQKLESSNKWAAFQNSFSVDVTINKLASLKNKSPQMRKRRKIYITSWLGSQGSMFTICSLVWQCWGCGISKTWGLVEIFRILGALPQGRIKVVLMRRCWKEAWLHPALSGFLVWRCHCLLPPTILLHCNPRDDTLKAVGSGEWG